MRKSLCTMIGNLGLTVAIGGANAAIIDFEEYVSVTVAPSILSGGFTFEPVTGQVFALPDANIQSSCSGGCASNGTTWFGASSGTPANTQPITMTRSSGASFVLLSLDASELFINNATTTLQIIGNLTAGGTISIDLALDGVNDSLGGAADFQSFVLPAIWGLSLLSSVDFNGFVGAAGTRGDISIDNLHVEAFPIPEPEIYAMLAAGLGLMGFVARRRNMQAAA